MKIKFYCNLARSCELNANAFNIFQLLTQISF